MNYNLYNKYTKINNHPINEDEINKIVNKKNIYKVMDNHEIKKIQTNKLRKIPCIVL